MGIRNEAVSEPGELATEFENEGIGNEVEDVPEERATRSEDVGSEGVGSETTGSEKKRLWR